MSKKLKHTATPWYSNLKADCKGKILIESKGDNFASNGVGFVFSKDDAQLILRAINLHEKMIEALEAAAWFQEHVIGKKKRVDWGKTFDIDWGGVNDALLKVSRTLAEVKSL